MKQIKRAKTMVLLHGWGFKVETEQGWGCDLKNKNNCLHFLRMRDPLTTRQVSTRSRTAPSLSCAEPPQNRAHAPPDLHRRVRALAILQTFIGIEPAWRVEHGIFELHCSDNESSSSPSSSPPSKQVIPNYEASVRSLAWNLKLHPEYLNNDAHDINTVVRLPEGTFSHGIAIEKLTDEIHEQSTRFNQPFPSASTLYA